MKEMIDNLINGNLSDAKRQAKGKSIAQIFRYLKLDCGWSNKRAVAAANYLKTGKGFQLYADEN